MGVQLTGYKIGGEIECGNCHTHIDVHGNPIEQKPSAAKKKALTNLDIFYRFLMWTLGLSVALGLFNAVFSK